MARQPPLHIAKGLSRMRVRLTTNEPFRYTAVFLGWGAVVLILDPKKPQACGLSLVYYSSKFMIVYFTSSWFIMVLHGLSHSPTNAMIVGVSPLCPKTIGLIQRQLQWQQVCDCGQKLKTKATQKAKSIKILLLRIQYTMCSIHI